MDEEMLLKVGSVLNQRCSSGVQNLLQEELDYILLWELNSEVNDGTFDQYLCNSSGDRAVEVVEVLERLGSVELVGVLRRVLSLLPGGWCIDQNERSVRVASVPNGSAQFHALTEAYYAALEAEDTVSVRMISRIHDAYKRQGIL